MYRKRTREEKTREEKNKGKKREELGLGTYLQLAGRKLNELVDTINRSARLSRCEIFTFPGTKMRLPVLG